MQLAVEFNQAALKSYEELLARLEERALDAEPVMERVADDVLLREREIFASENGGLWPPLSQEWAARKAKRGLPTRVLSYTETLERSLTERHAKYGLRLTGPGELVVGTTDPVAHLHERGTANRYVKRWRGREMSRPRFAGKLPRRPVMEFGPADVQRWSGYLLDWLGGEAEVNVGL